MLISTLFSIFLRLLNVEKMYWIATGLNTDNFRMSSECKCWNGSCFISPNVCNTLWFFLRPHVICLRSWSVQGALYILKCRQLQHFEAFFYSCRRAGFWSWLGIGRSYRQDCIDTSSSIIGRLRRSIFSVAWWLSNPHTKLQTCNDVPQGNVFPDL